MLDETKTVQQKTAETLQMASKWEANNQQQQPPAVIIPTRYGDIQQQPCGSFPLEVIRLFASELCDRSLLLVFDIQTQCSSKAD